MPNKKLPKYKDDKESGIVALLVTVIILFVSFVLAVSVSLIFLSRLSATRNVALSEKSYFAAEAGIEDALLRFLDGNKNLPPSYTLSLGESVAAVNIEEALGITTIRSNGDTGGRIRKLKTILQLEADEASFFFGAQIGDGGLKMQNDAKVIGNVFSNGNIEGNNDPIVTGDAFAAGISFIDGLVVGGNAQAYDLSDCKVLGDATYENSITDCDVSGTTKQGSNVAPADMPIPDEKIEEWKQEAEAGGIEDCDGGGEYRPGDGARIGPLKIECDLKLQEQDEVTIAGYVWVEGDIILQNQSVLKLDSSFESLSSAVIADNPVDSAGSGTIKVQNLAEVRGSGEKGSFLVMVSMNNSAEAGGGTQAIAVQNSSSSSVFYAPHGLIVIQNNIELVEVTAYQLELENSAVVKYEQGLTNMRFSSGPTGGYTVQTWEED